MQDAPTIAAAILKPCVLYRVACGRPGFGCANDIHHRWFATVHPVVPDEVGPNVWQVSVAPPPTATLVAADCVMVLVGVDVYVVVPTVAYGRLLRTESAGRLTPSGTPHHPRPLPDSLWPSTGLSYGSALMHLPTTQE
jgi:hypothetical protein